MKEHHTAAFPRVTFHQKAIGSGRGLVISAYETTYRMKGKHDLMH